MLTSLQASDMLITRAPGLTLGGTVKGDPVKEIIKAAFDYGGLTTIGTVQCLSKMAFIRTGVNMFDTAESYSGGQSEIEM